MDSPTKKISPALFGVILVSFFLPFVNISCQSQKLMTLTGVQLATGTTIEQPSLFGRETKKQEIPAEPMAIFSLIAAVVGLGTSFLKTKNSAVAPAASGGIGLVLTLIMKSKIDDAVLKNGQGIIQVDYEIGFWLVFLLFLSAAILNAYNLYQEKDKAN